jgi:Tol biopolymer transport system component
MSTVYAISPNGRELIYRTTKSADRQTWQLWLRTLGSLDARLVPGTVGIIGVNAQTTLGVAWSPDSRSVAFAGTAGLTRVEVGTGQTAVLVPTGLGVIQLPGAWSRDGVILFGRRSGLETHGSGIWRVADSGDTPKAVTELRAGEVFHSPSGFLPDGHRFLYFVAKNGDAGDVRIGSIDAAPADQRADTLFSADGPAVYSSGFLLFVSRGSLIAQPFDPARGTLTGSPALVESGVAPSVSVSDAGHLVYRQDGDSGASLSELVRFRRDGTVLGKIGLPAAYSEISLAPNGRQLVVARAERGAPTHVEVVDLARGVFSRLTPGNIADYAAEMSPNDTVAYTYSPDGVSRDIYVRAANGVGEPRRLVASDTVKHPNGWSPDGRFLIYDDHVPGRLQDLLVVRQEGGAPIPFLATEADETYGQFSPDGKWIAYRSTESGRPEVYVRDFAPDRSPAYGTEKIRISVNTGDKPRWSPNGREIYFFQGTTLMAAPVRPGKPFYVGAAVKLFDAITTGYIPYDAMRDGTFVANVVGQSGATGELPLRVLLNWPSAMRKDVK